MSAGHEVESEAGVCKTSESVQSFCRLHRNTYSQASLSISVTLTTSPLEYSLEMVPKKGQKGATIEEMMAKGRKSKHPYKSNNQTNQNQKQEIADDANRHTRIMQKHGCSVKLILPTVIGKTAGLDRDVAVSSQIQVSTLTSHPPKLMQRHRNRPCQQKVQYPFLTNASTWYPRGAREC